jgi:hypothetical protein
MKKILYTFIAALAIAACGGNIDPETPPTDKPSGGETTEKPNEQPVEKLADKIIGEWHSTSLAIDGDVYLSFTADGKFDLYQKIGEGRYRLYKGIWNINESTAVLSGKYNDDTDWGASYKIVISSNKMTLTSVNEAAEESEYTKAEIPAEVKDNC